MHMTTQGHSSQQRCSSLHDSAYIAKSLHQGYELNISLKSLTT